MPAAGGLGLPILEDQLFEVLDLLLHMIYRIL